ncbi:MAG TPA: asparagine synthase (glutamine-hydrolyzing) [Sedimentisphaerales bacterium]|nr:asparagine synthase (glutamine-hydrolyzing) [Sedimentisphaerales bacterium]
MCGIVGIVSQMPVEDRELLVRQRDALRHRGPDDAGVWWSGDNRVGLAHRRLAILDLSPTGHQPMLDESGQFCIVFNGEIYNFVDLRRELKDCGHRFCSSSDTAVILAAYRQWGTTCLQHFNGMFAFALYDVRKQRMFLARDRAGEKPLFYRLSPQGIEFASELKALMASPCFARRLDPEALDCYLAFGYVPGDRCILQGLNKLPPAHAMTFDWRTGRSSIWRYWEPPGPPMGRFKGEDGTGLADELEHLLEGAVRRQLVADVPVGILLSGGVDSSLVTAMATRVASQIKTFTICFPGYGKFDETEHARLIARHFGTEHVELEAEPSTVELLPLLARQFDEPMVDSSMIPTYLVSKLVRQHCTVALGGDGGDELFAGYSHYNRLLGMREGLGWIPRGLRRIVSGLSLRCLPIGTKGRNWLGGLGTDFHQDLPLIAKYFDSSARRALLARNGFSLEPSGFPAESIHRGRVPRVTGLLERATLMDFENYLPEDILVKVDRASMLHSLEVRAPFLDYRIIEFAFGKVPWNLKATATTRKILLKRLAERVLPPQFDPHRKRGFSIPLAAWLRNGPWMDFFQDVLLGDRDSLFDRRCVSRLLEGQKKGRANSERLFALVLFALWKKEYRIS